MRNKRNCKNRLKQHWYTNGDIELMCPEANCPVGFVSGRAIKVLNKISETEKGKIIPPNVIEKVASKHRGKPSGMLGKHQTKEAKIKIGIASRQRIVSDETRIKISKIHKGKKLSKEHIEKLSKAHKGKIPWNKGMKNQYKQRIESVEKRRNSLLGHKHTSETKEKMSKICSSKEHQEKINNTKKLNKSFNTSKDEEFFYSFLLSIFSKEEIIRQYKSEVYPFACDFYIKPLNLFIELNHSQYHCDHPFDSTNKNDLEKLKTLKEKSLKLKQDDRRVITQYDKMIETWTIRDVEKIKCARKNNLNYYVSYNKNDLQALMNYILTFVKKDV